MKVQEKRYFQDPALFSLISGLWLAFTIMAVLLARSRRSLRRLKELCRPACTDVERGQTIHSSRTLVCDQRQALLESTLEARAGRQSAEHAFTTGADTSEKRPAKDTFTTVVRRRRPFLSEIQYLSRQTSFVGQRENGPPPPPSPPSLTSLSSAKESSVDTDLASNVHQGCFNLRRGNDGVLERQMTPADPAKLECFFWFLGCDFETEDEDVWKVHSLGHFRDTPPPNSSACPFCIQRYDFADDDDVRNAWHAEMEHVASHLRDGMRFSETQVPLSLMQCLYHLHIINFDELVELKIHGRLWSRNWRTRSAIAQAWMHRTQRSSSSSLGEERSAP